MRPEEIILTVLASAGIVGVVIIALIWLARSLYVQVLARVHIPVKESTDSEK